MCRICFADSQKQRQTPHLAHALAHFSAVLVAATTLPLLGCQTSASSTQNNSPITDGHTAANTQNDHAAAEKTHAFDPFRDGHQNEPKVPSNKRLRLFVGPRFITNEPFMPEAAAVAVDDDGRVRALFREVPDPQKLSDDYVRVELPAKLAVPGIHDAHVHILGVGQRDEFIDLVGATSIAEIKKRIVAFAKAHPHLAALRGRGWDQNLFTDTNKDKPFPKASDLDGIFASLGEKTEKPILLTRIDGHASWSNRALLEKAQITAATTDPAGGKLIRDSKGNPTGIYIDNAMDLPNHQMPAPTNDDLERWLKKGLAAFAQAGDVAVHDMGLPLAAVPILQKLDAAGELPVRVFVYLDGNDPRAFAYAEKFSLKHPENPSTTTATKADLAKTRLEIRGIKFYADGALGSRGAALLEDYSDDPNNRGLILVEQKILEENVRHAQRLGLQVAIHAIGDAANRAVLQAIDAGAGKQDESTAIRHRVEHAQTINSDDQKYFAPLFAVASMQPTHATSDAPWAVARLGPERIKTAYAWSSLHQQHAVLAFGSDAPIESEDPRLGMFAALARTGLDAAEKLDESTALQAFTKGAAWAVHREHDLGALTPGMLFDITLLGDDPHGDANAWRTTPINGIVVGGQLHLHPSVK